MLGLHNELEGIQRLSVWLAQKDNTARGSIAVMRLADFVHTYRAL